MTGARRIRTDDPRLRAWAAVLSVHAKVVAQIDRRMRDDAGMPLSWYDVLITLEHSPDRRLRVTALADRVVLSRSRVSRVVDELDRAGLVARSPDPADGRAFVVAATPEGRRRFRRAAVVHVRAIGETFASKLTIAEGRAVAEALGRLAPMPGGRPPTGGGRADR